MGRLAHMHSSTTRVQIAFIVGMMLVLMSCSLTSPITMTDRPLSERIDEEEITTAEPVAGPIVAPESLAFGQALATGDYLRLIVSAEGVDAPLRSGPGASYDRIAEVPSGAEVLASGNQTGEWVHVMYGDFEGWVRTDRISFGSDDDLDRVVDGADVATAQVQYEVVGEAIGVNLRAEPNAASELVSGAPVGTRVTGTGNTDGTWIEVTYEEVTGWASGNYLEPITDAAEGAPTND